MTGKIWPDFDRVTSKPTKLHPYYRVLLAAKNPRDGKQKMGKGKSKTYDEALANAYYALQRKCR